MARRCALKAPSIYDHALRHAGRGMRVFPLVPYSGDGRAQDGKLPLIEDFPNRATCDPVTLRRWLMDEVMDLPHHVGIGLAMGRTDDGAYLFAIDVDNKGDKNGSAELLKLEAQGCELPETYTQFTPSGGRHMVYRAPYAVRQGVDVLGRGLDIRSAGGFIVASGTRFGDKGEYTDNSAAVADAPAWLLERLGRMPERTKMEAPDFIDRDRARERAIHYLRNDAPESIKGSGGDHTAYRVAARVKDFGVSETDALDLMMEHWFEGSGWSRDRLGEKIAHAYRYGRNAPGASAAEAQFGSVANTSADASQIVALKDVELPNGARHLVRDLLGSGDASALYGDSNVGKTFVAVDLALSIAAGRAWRSREVEHGAVLYLALEGGAGIKKRAVAARQYHGLDGVDVPLFLLTASLNLLHAPDVEALMGFVREVEKISGKPVVLLVVDTLAAATAGSDENSAADMTAFIRNINAVRALGPHVLIIHHSGKDASKGARGHSSLRAAVDSMLEVVNGSIHVRKQRDMEFAPPMAFRLHQVQIGKDDTGAPITSCVVVHNDAAAQFNRPTEQFKPGTKTHDVAAVLLDLIAAEGQMVDGLMSVPTGRWRDEWRARNGLKRDVHRGGKNEAVDKAFARARTKLMSTGHTRESREFAGFSPASDIPDIFDVPARTCGGHRGHLSREMSRVSAPTETDD
jgi:hypothetical protein